MNGAKSVSVSRSVVVETGIDRAFQVFTGHIGRWWPLESHHTNPAGAETAIMEPREGGRWFERAADGSEADWGRVLVWDPPHHLVLAWHLSPEWTFDPDPDHASEVVVRFIAEDERRTRVELVHRKLEVYGAKTEAMRETFEQPNAWGDLLRMFADFAAGDER